jgi:hypothetical protein
MRCEELLNERLAGFALPAWNAEDVGDAVVDLRWRQPWLP